MSKLREILREIMKNAKKAVSEFAEGKRIKFFPMKHKGYIIEFTERDIFYKEQFKNIFGLGYARISSQHSPTNSAVLSFKLKAGFVIVGQETHECW
ncbi:MAG: hypothetical protein PHY93_03130 [Bacteriovorax sp.]|nr:hypothetical protein [Bacteriovorax sp.]